MPEPAELAIRAGDALPMAAFAAWTGLMTLKARIVDPLAREFEACSGMPVSGFQALELLRARPSGLRMAELADALGLSRGGTTKVVTRLETEGYVMRVTPAGDRRATYARITEPGIVAVEQASPVHRRLVLEHLAPYLDGTDLGPLTQIATRLTARG